MDKEDCSGDRDNETQPLLGAMSTEDNLQSLKWPHMPFKNVVQQSGQRNATSTTNLQKTEKEEQVSGTSTKGDGNSGLLWKPLILDKHLKVPDYTSHTEFPKLTQQKLSKSK